MVQTIAHTVCDNVEQGWSRRLDPCSRAVQSLHRGRGLVRPFVRRLLRLKTMINVPRKHVGIFLGVTPQIWHDSNSKHKVVCQSPEDFSHHYSSPDNAMFWGQLP